MPNKTFFNLSYEKKQKIISISIKHFSRGNYDSVSLNQIISDLKIAKGSFYRYFNNKKDLFDYLYDYCITMKTNYIEENVDYSISNIFEALRTVSNFYFRFQVHFPEYNRFLHQYTSSTKIHAHATNILKKHEAFIKELIKKSIENNEIDNKYDEKLVYQFLVTFIGTLISCYQDELNENDNISDQLISIVKFGLIPKK